MPIPNSFQTFPCCPGTVAFRLPVPSHSARMSRKCLKMSHRVPLVSHSCHVLTPEWLSWDRIFPDFTLKPHKMSQLSHDKFLCPVPSARRPGQQRIFERRREAAQFELALPFPA